MWVFFSYLVPQLTVQKTLGDFCDHVSFQALISFFLFYPRPCFGTGEVFLNLAPKNGSKKKHLGWDALGDFRKKYLVRKLKYKGETNSENLD